MRLATVTAWIFVGFGLLMIGALLYLFQITEGLARFLGVVGVIYFAVGVVLSVIHDQHMAERTRAGRE
jgi:predicted membrane channel-forming protein YqfA (hemolysin III family)